jgi:hypothetical protein
MEAINRAPPCGGGWKECPREAPRQWKAGGSILAEDADNDFRPLPSEGVAPNEPLRLSFSDGDPEALGC